MLFFNLNRLFTNQTTKTQQEKIYNHIQPDGKKIQIFVDDVGHLTGEILHKGKILHARIKGLPAIISLNHLDNVKKILQSDCCFKILFDDIVVIPKLRGGEPISITAALLYAGLVLSGVVTGGAIVAATAQPSTTIKGNYTEQRTYGDNSHAISISKTIFDGLPKINSKEGWIITSSLILAVASYGSYYYLEYRNRSKKDDKGNTPLHLAVIEESIQKVCKLLNVDSVIGYFKPCVDVNAKNSDGDTALHLAVREGYTEIVEILRQNKASGLIRNKNKETPFDMANSSTEAMKIAIGIDSVVNQKY